jgi:hypothetical protein
MHSSRSLVYGEILARCTRAVYPSRFIRTAPSWGASVFHRLWLGHMYMGIKGLPIHSAQSPVYGETLARCTYAVYPPRFLLTTPSWEGGGGGASVFHRIWLGHMYMGSKFLPIHSSRSLVHDETLAHCTRAVYPPRFLLTVAHWWASVFLWLWLDHMYMGIKGLPMHSPLSPV